MERGEVFSLQCVKYDKDSGTGGGLMTIDEAWLVKKDPAQNKSASSGHSPVNYDDMIPSSDKPKNPNHYLHYTRNIRILKNGIPVGNQIRKIHPPLVLIYRGMKVVP